VSECECVSVYLTRCRHQGLVTLHATYHTQAGIRLSELLRKLKPSGEKEYYLDLPLDSKALLWKHDWSAVEVKSKGYDFVPTNLRLTGYRVAGMRVCACACACVLMPLGLHSDVRVALVSNDHNGAMRIWSNTYVASQYRAKGADSSWGETVCVCVEQI